MSHVKLSNGTTLFVDRQGSGPIVIFLHGLGGTHNLFRAAYQLARLTETHTVISLDNAGHGLSPPNKNPTDVNSYVDDLECFIDTLHVNQVALIGQSWGAITAALYASRHPHRVSALSLYGMISSPLPPQVTKGQREVLALIRSTGLPALSDGFCATFYNSGKDPLPTVGTALRSMMLSTPTKNFADTFEGLIDFSARESGIRWHTFTFPFQIVTGTLDKLHPPPMAEALKKKSPPSCRLILLENLGHSVPIEVPRTTAQLIRELLGLSP